MEKVILLTSTMLLSTSLYATEYRIQHCQSCSPNDSKQLALQHFKPAISCRFSGGKKDAEQTELCTSTPVDAYIYSDNNQQLLKFHIAHQRQNVDRSTLQESLSATALAAPPAEIRQMAIDGVYIFNELQKADQRAVQSYIQASNGTANPFAADLSEHLAHIQPLSTSECASSDAAKALRHALTPSTVAAVQDHIESLAAIDRSSVLGTMKNLYKDYSLAISGAELALEGKTGNKLLLRFRPSFTKYKLNISYDRGMVWTSEGVASPASANRVVFDVAAEGGGMYRVSVDHNRSRIEGQSLENVLSDRNTGATLSKCAFETLKQTVIPDVAIKDKNSTGGIGGNAEGSGAPRTGLEPFTGGGGGSRRWKCEYTFRMRSGTFSYIALCP